MKKFEYLIDWDLCDFLDLHDRLNELGQEGWELCLMIDNRKTDSLFYLFFKREINE